MKHTIVHNGKEWTLYRIISDRCISISLPEIRSTVSVDFVPPEWWVSRALVSKRELRGQGLGSLMLQHALDELRERAAKTGESYCVLVTPGGYDEDPRQEAFYLKNGFVKTAEEGLLSWTC
jgi:GNAT superfamily N-acetyltransferase